MLGMENYFTRVAPLLAFALLPLASFANEGDIEIKPVKVVDPKVDRREVNGAAIDTERFEVGVFSGVLSVEDFSSNLLYGVSASYHISDRWLLQLNYGQSDVEKSTYEEVIDSSFLSDDDRQFEYYHVLGGYNLFPGRSFLGEKSKYNSGIYLLAGVGNTRFAGNDNFTLVFGGSYRVVATDWLTCSLDLRDHIVEREFIDDKKSTHNIEMSIGVNVLF
jgi:outer membrane beta-barrel protein